ncbi:MBL fold metallo-hydrolase [Tahibacter caeni]|uniref:MBL fold metallo-hydrolase n=1 Tax=Tahibacter caeni TaxID=1453545 RepID=UPI00214995B5|nr:MBL fold metallo-hydrolase [Tahibacter caeni]
MIFTAAVSARVTSFLLCLALSAAATAAEPAAGFRRIPFGAFTVVALSDGNFDLPTDRLLVEDTPGRAVELLAQAGLPSTVPTSVNAYLVDTGRRRVLVDAGAGSLLGPGLGQVQQHLRAAGYAPEQIDDVLITHLHPDHSGGLSVEGRAAFPNAVVHVDADESAFWLDKANAARVDDNVKGAFDAAAAALQPYQAQGRLKTFRAGTRVTDGIDAVASHGHTAGHTAFRVRSGKQTLLLWGDVVHVGAVQFADPAVTIRFDSVPAEARAERLRRYADAAKHGYWVGGAHLAFPGIGRVEKDGDHYAWRVVDTAR